MMRCREERVRPMRTERISFRAALPLLLVVVARREERGGGRRIDVMVCRSLVNDSWVRF